MRKKHKVNNVTREQEEVEIEARHCGESRAAEQYAARDGWEDEKMQRCPTEIPHQNRYVLSHDALWQLHMEN